MRHVMKYKKVLIILLVILAVIIGSRYFKHPEQIAPDATIVQTTHVKEKFLPLEMTAMGNLVAARSVEITSELAGHVSRVGFQDGSLVKANELLIQLDDATYKAQYESANAQYTYSEGDYHRLAKLIDKHFISMRDIDKAQADMKERRAAAQQFASMVNKMHLTAPFEGMVGQSKVSVGDYVNAGQSLVTLTDTHHLRIEYTVPEKYLPMLALGQTVAIKTAAYPAKSFTGKVAFISPTVSADTRSISLYADVENNDDVLKPGMFVNVAQSLGKEEHVVMIPARSLVPILDGVQAFKVVDGKAYSVAVTLGKRSNDEVQVTQGLSAGDEIITDGQFKVKNGMPVKVKA